MIIEIAAAIVWGAVAGYFHYSLAKLAQVLAIVTALGLWHHRDLMTRARREAYGERMGPAWVMAASWSAAFLCWLLIALTVAAVPYWLAATLHHTSK